MSCWRSFNISVNDEEIEKGARKVDSFTSKLQAAGVVVAEAFAFDAIKEFVGETIEAGARVVDLSNRLGLGARELQEWQFAARTAGVEGESAAHSLGFLNKAVGEAVVGGGEAADTFRKLHVALKDGNGKIRGTSEILGDVADEISKLPDQQTRAAYAMRLFGREGQQLLPVLAGGSEGLGKLREEFEELGGGMSDQFVKDAKAADDAFAGLKVGMESLKSRIVGAMLPAIQAFTTRAKGWIKTAADMLDHTDVLRHGLEMLSILAGGKAVLSLGKLAKAFGLLKPSIWGTLSALFEFAVPIILVGVFVALIEDLWTAMEGGDSVIGDLLAQLGGVGASQAFFQELRDAWNELKFSLGDISWGDAIGGTINFLVGAFYELIEGAKLLVHTLKTIGDVGGNAIGWLVGKVTGNKGLTDASSNAMGRDFDKDSGKVVGDLDAMWNPNSHWRDHPAAQTVPGEAFDKGPGAVSVGPLQYGAPTVAQGSGHTINNNQKVTVNVDAKGAKDPKAVGDAARDGTMSAVQTDNWNASEALGQM